MSDLIEDREVSDSKNCPPSSSKPIQQLLKTHNALIGKGVTIRRALPHAARRMIGAWCFFDHFGPLNLKDNDLDIPPHPHIGLQTFTWTLAGEILHRDSIGSEQIIHPGAVNLMTSGLGIAHSEQSVPNGILHGVQLWIALPEKVRNMPPAFEHHAKMPTLEQDGLQITLLAGKEFNLQAPTTVYSPLVGLDLFAKENVNTTLPLNPRFEYGILPLSDTMTVEGQTIGQDTLLYLGCGRTSLSLQANKNAHALLIGGEPFAEEILVWWNFVARTREEMLAAVNDWEQKKRFGEVVGYQGGRLQAPNLKE